VSLRTLMRPALTGAFVLAALTTPALATAAAAPNGIVAVPRAGAGAVRPAFTNCTISNPTGNIALTPGSTLSAGAALCAGSYELILQTDGNMVVYGPSGAIWYSGTAVGTTNAVMQTDGNFVVYSSTHTALWNSETGGNPGAYVCIQTDGNLVVYAYNNGSYTCSGHYLWDSKG
jgi:hypothetical protein